MKDWYDQERGVPLGSRAPFSLQAPDGGSLQALSAELQVSRAGAALQEVTLALKVSEDDWQQIARQGLFRTRRPGSPVGADSGDAEGEARELKVVLRPEIAQLLFAVCADVAEMKEMVEELGAASIFRRTESWRLVDPAGLEEGDTSVALGLDADPERQT